MSDIPAPRSLVVNWNAPELNELALALARSGRLTGFVRPYVNKGRAWERGLAKLPLAGRLYAATFGRRQLADPLLAARTFEAGVWPDLAAAALGHLSAVSASTRERWQSGLYRQVRQAVAERARQATGDARCVIAYEGFARPAFEALRPRPDSRAVLSYPVAHHRHRRRVRLQENERQPDFAATWPDFDDWPRGHEAQLDEEIELADLVLVGSSYAHDTFVAEGVPEAKLCVVPYGVDLGLFRPGAVAASGATQAGESRFEVMFSGQLTQRKGLSYLLQAWREFQHPDARLTLVGTRVGAASWLDAAGATVRHLPHQTRPQLAALYRAADVFVFPTLVEGMPLVVLEAMASGLPVIATANGPGDLVRDGIDGFIVPERDASAVAERLHRLWRDPGLRLRMGRSAAQRAQQFGWDAYTRKALQAVAALWP